MAPLSRRSLLSGIAAMGAAAGAGALPVRPAFAADTLHVLSWGWGYDTAINEAVRPRYSKAGVELEIGTNAANYAKLIAQRSNPILSGGAFNGTFSYRGYVDKLWSKIDKSSIPNAANVPDLAYLQTGGVTFGVQPYGLIYNPKFIEEPKSYLDLFNPKYKGKVGLSDYYFDGFSLTAKSLGKDIDDVPAGIAEWAKHKQNIGPWNQSPAHVNDLVERGELWVAFTFGGIAAGAISMGKKIAFTIPKEGASAVADVVHAIVGFDDKTTQETKEFLGLFLDDKAQESFTRHVYTSPVSTTAKIPADLASSPAILSPKKVAGLYRPDLARGAQQFGEYKNLVNRQLKA
jgi:putative spermidine/putrescine transport system substrate-binding protein